MSARTQRRRTRPKLQEVGAIRKDAPVRVVLVYPSPYRVAMASLGYQTLYRLLNDIPGVCCERAVLESAAQEAPLRTLETDRPVADGTVVALSISTESEVALAAAALLKAGLEPLERRRRDSLESPLIVAGGPLTYADPSPLAALADVVLCGECEDTLTRLLALVAEELERSELLSRAAEITGAIVPALAAPVLAELARCDASWLPAYSAVLTPQAEFGDTFLVEAARGCPRRCSFCVMESTRFRPIPPRDVLDRVPEHAKRVGVVGAALLDHPHITEIVAQLVERDLQVSLSSLRADRLDDELLELLVRGGARSLTIAADGASEKLRKQIRKRIGEEDLLRTARLAADAGLGRLKLYAMIGLPGEEQEDILELCGLSLELSKILPLSLAVSPFVPKARTSLADADFAPLPVLRRRLSLIRKRFRGRVDLRSTSVRNAWIEHAVARGGIRAGVAAVDVARGGCTFASWREAIRRFDLLSSGV